MNPPNRFSWAKWIVVAVVIGLAYAGYSHWKKPEVQVPELRTATVTRGDVVQMVTANGSLTPVRSVQVGSQISGTITRINVDYNARVKAGDIIAQIDPATYERALLQAKAELANAVASRNLAKLNFERTRELAENELISRAEYDQTQVALEQAEAVVQMREANVERAKVDLDRTTIYAPIDGVVISRSVEEGQTVAASFNTPTLFLIANDLAKMQIEAAVSEADVGGVEEGQRVEFTVDAFMNRKFEGAVRQVRFAPVTNQNVVTYTTVVDVDNRDLKLRPGMTATASVIVAERRGALKIPNAALRFKPPEGVKVIGLGGSEASNAAPAVRLAESGPFAGLPVPPWMEEQRRPTPEERAKYEAALTPEQKQKYDVIRQNMRAMMQGGGGGGFAGFAGGSQPSFERESSGPRTQTIYVVEGATSEKGSKMPPAVREVTVKLGISDGTFTEVIDGLKENDVVATGTMGAANTIAGTGPRGGRPPFGGPPFGRIR